jgi:PleD family two-component response regulator
MSDADKALYVAKHQGRNQVITAATTDKMARTGG